MITKPLWKTVANTLLATAIVSLVGCSQPAHRSGPVDAPNMDGLDAAENSVKATKSGTSKQPGGTAPVAVVDGQALDQSALSDRLSEAAGAVILEELILDHLLALQAAQAGVSVQDEALNVEKLLLEQSISDQTGLPPSQTSTLTKQVLRSRGLGPIRFEALIRRNALLRALSQSEVQVSQSDIDEAVLLAFGPRLVARVILLSTQQAAAEVRTALTDETLPMQPPAVSARFSQSAVERSSDVSAPRGGRLDPISPTDASVPSMIRNTLAGMEPGQISPIMAVDDGYALFLLEERLPAKLNPTPQDRESVSRSLRMRREREAMDRLARRLLDSASITIFDRSLRWSWDARPGGGE